MLWYVMVCYGMLWYVMVCYGMLWYVMVCYGMLWNVMVCYDMLWYFIVCYGMLWYARQSIEHILPPARLLNLLDPELFFLVLAQPVYKMRIIQEPNAIEL